MQMNRPRLIGSLVALLAFAAPATEGYTQAYNGEQIAFQGTNAVRRITMGVGKSLIVNLPAAAGEIFVGNPAVANAVVRSPRKIYIIGQATGQTTIYAMDKQGRRIATLELSIGRDIGELQSIIHTALPSAHIVARTVNDSIILTGEVDSPGDMQTALDIAKGFVDSLNKGAGGGPTGAPAAGMVVNAMTIKGRDEVMIKVTIAEIQRNIAKQLGVSSSTLAGNWGTFTQQNPFTINGNALTDGALNTVTHFGGPWTLNQTLTAFERAGVAHTLAEPTVTAVSGENAKFTVGGEVPINAGTVCTGTGTTSNCQASVTYKSYGVTLNFTPVVLSSGRITLRLATEVSDIDPATSSVINGMSVPGFRTRRHDTTVELPSGGSIATAGLIESSSNQAMNGTPGVMNLPILGQLFRSRDYQRKETELMIIVTPYLVKAVPNSALARPDDNFADANDPQAWLLGRVNRLYSTTDNPEAAAHFSGRVGFIHD
ncbi:type II and III secretion system protein family protein [Rhodoblastus acidophilus]|uniref:Type II and III secretion system protein family protein n=1 Tax=Candidatus Rhodoblastus alkanivorans TaxID=2954117 RepID=A0ABS9ZAH6_9HYPH|nr:type II and III secretion system protein family protein [Candidatus Rhodoblastus alkanivorans]MCI4677803.1 type II and III secretion system protein family protein [Candidatus Rhodoblastus alkanivorans]MCI4684699.1 type II and III secretion system protein family protein [Candidatus Rhodoblastus alkanivorans]MDI4642021.1 type II and III secretion system protein family protein [Rhodoblastus acidophilus]